MVRVQRRWSHTEEHVQLGGVGWREGALALLHRTSQRAGFRTLMPKQVFALDSAGHSGRRASAFVEPSGELLVDEMVLAPQ